MSPPDSSPRLARSAGVFGLATMALAQSNANGIGYFALEVPPDITITIDGDDADWMWYDPIFAVGPDEMYEIQKAETVDKSDLDIAIMTGWTGTDRDNKLYGFVRVTDDTLVVSATNFDDGWRDDVSWHLCPVHYTNASWVRKCLTKGYHVASSLPAFLFAVLAGPLSEDIGTWSLRGAICARRVPASVPAVPYSSTLALRTSWLVSVRAVAFSTGP